MTTKISQITVPVQRQATEADLTEAIRRVRAKMPDPLIFQAVKAKLGFDPSAPVRVPQKPSVKRDRQRASRLTKLVWESINADGTFDPDKAVPPAVTNTRELAIIAKRSTN